MFMVYAAVIDSMLFCYCYCFCSGEGKSRKRTALQFDPRVELDRHTTTEQCDAAVKSLLREASNTCIGYLWGVGPSVPDFTVEVEVNTSPGIAEATACLILSRNSVPVDVLNKQLDGDTVSYIEKQTVGQTSSTLWHNLHRGRITSSVFGSVYKAVESSSLVNRIIDNRLLIFNRLLYVEY